MSKGPQKASASERSGYFRKVTGAQAPYHPDGGDIALVFP